MYLFGNPYFNINKSQHRLGERSETFSKKPVLPLFVIYLTRMVLRNFQFLWFYLSWQD